MSTTPPPADPKKQLNSALLWTVVAAAFSVGMFYYSGQVAPEKKNFYLIGGAVAGILTIINGYGAWTAYNKTKQQPPTAPK